MSEIRVEIRSGAYYDSVILMQLQRALAGLPDVLDAGAVMGTEANKHILEQSDLLPEEGHAAGADDLLIVVKAEKAAAALEALNKVDELLANRSKSVDQEYLPKSLDTAVELAPGAHWVLVSVPGRHAAGVARNALDLGKNVFLYSDNVTLEDEIALKERANELGLLVMGPDCGTAIINGVGLGFANQIRRGPIGMVAASGTGLQAVSVRIHQLGSGVTHALGTGGRDLKADVHALTARQGIELLAQDPDTKVIVLISKPPSPEVANQLIQQCSRMQKPIVVNFIGHPAGSDRVGAVFFASSFDEAARMAVDLVDDGLDGSETSAPGSDGFSKGQVYLRGLFSGGTLAYETLLILRDRLPQVYSNVPLREEDRLPDSMVSLKHSIVDLGEDEFTVGRLHPMMDNDLRIRRLEQEADDPEVAVILLDVVLGHGAHPDPASELAPAIEKAIRSTKKAKRRLVVVALVLGTDEDPQDMQAQIDQLEAAGARVYTVNAEAARYAGGLVNALSGQPLDDNTPPVDLAVLSDPLSAINVGLASFAESLTAQEAPVVHVDWRPPAGGNEQLMSILERMKSK